MSNTTIDASARATRGQAPVSTLMYKGDILDATVTSMNVLFMEGQHDQATLSCISPTLEDTEGFVDSTFSFYFGVAPRASLFQGYITAVTDQQDAQGQLSFTLTLLGASKVMYEGKPRYWLNKTGTDAVRDLASANNLGYYGHTHNYTWRSLAQTEESDWTTVTKMATRLGWVVYYRFGCLLFYDPNRLYLNSGEYTSLLSSATNSESIDEASSRNMLSFEATEDAKILPQNLGQRFGYFTTANDPVVKEQPGEFKGYRFETSTTVRDQDEANAFITAADTSIADWPHHGLARIWGDADIYPGMCVGIITTMNGYSKNDGRWLVRSVSHQADRQSYQTQLALSRPEKWVAFIGSTYRPFWEEDMTTTRSRPYLQESQGRWISSWRTT